MRRNMTFQETDKMRKLIKIAADNRNITASELCREAIREKLIKEGLLDDMGDPFVGVLNNGNL